MLQSLDQQAVQGQGLMFTAFLGSLLEKYRQLWCRFQLSRTIRKAKCLLGLGKVSARIKTSDPLFVKIYNVTPNKFQTDYKYGLKKVHVHHKHIHVYRPCKQCGYRPTSQLVDFSQLLGQQLVDNGKSQVAQRYLKYPSI